MSNKIFISQGTLELSRNRAERRLNAILDNQQKMLSHTNTFQFVDTGEAGNFGFDTIFTSFPSPVYCKHSDYCTSPHKFSMKCNFSQDCQIKKFYDKYSKNRDES